MKRLKITDDHGFTARKLRKEERKIKDASLRQRVTAVRLIMEGYLGKEVAEMLNLHVNPCLPMSSYLMKVDWRSYSIKNSSRKVSVSDRRTTEEVKTHDFTQHSFRTRIGNRCFLEYSYHSILPSKSIRDFHDKGMGE